MYGSGEALDASVYTGLQFPWLVVVGGEKGHLEGEHLFDARLGEIFGDENAHLFSVVFPKEGDNGRQQLLAQQDDGDGGQNLGSLYPCEVFVLYQGIDGIDGFIEDDGVYLGCQGTDEGEGQRGDYQPSVRLDVGVYVLE